MYTSFEVNHTKSERQYLQKYTVLYSSVVDQILLLDPNPTFQIVRVMLRRKSVNTFPF